ncbi:HAD hydrolase-like protein [Streptomyces sp. NBC_01387]|uniref:HAD family hydrolase n=1 Tax=unclassified Streptomyces TaxID=2593676 RepID=UPI002256F4DE|nr:HAD hydrolase-like protein [Streptomyces sp. NBC_01500]MCX4549969.1 HAD hydrolase-like protein [Streptomyces sp. NBC_01500]WSV55421.1 HAD hydrolase-like protein [Streptomyces sp. NBC_01014]
MIRENLRDRIRSTRSVLLGFDGPICRLFARHEALGVAAGMRQFLAERGVDLAPGAAPETAGPHDILRAVGALHPGSALIVDLEEWLARQEQLAVPGAWPTMYADGVMRTWSASGCRLAVTTDNSARAVHAYLAARSLSECFGPHIHGRTADIQLLKPHPHTLEKALAGLDADRSSTLVVGDTVTDLEAAQEAGLAFLGYATNDRSVDELASAGADLVLNTWEPVLDILWGR